MKTGTDSINLLFQKILSYIITTFCINCPYIAWNSSFSLRFAPYKADQPLGMEVQKKPRRKRWKTHRRTDFKECEDYWCLLKGYFHYKMIASENVVIKAKFRIFFISWKSCSLLELFIFLYFKPFHQLWKSWQHDEY